MLKMKNTVTGACAVRDANQRKAVWEKYILERIVKKWHLL